MKKLLLYLLATLGLLQPCGAQYLKPGFSPTEYIEALKISSRCVADSSYYSQVGEPTFFKKAYRSKTMGLDNLWELWVDPVNTVAAISIRGTTAQSASWLANLYAAMVPARGKLQLGVKDTFTYQLAYNPRAAVHVGWLVSTGFLVKDILPKVDSCYKAGIKDFILVGHSQGAAIASLLSAYLHHLQYQKALPSDLHIKTYCSASPKVGNLYFAYEYEAMTQEGWAYTVVNSADWVPEVPVTVQTLNDFNKTNPFKNAPAYIKSQKFPNSVMLKHVYSQLTEPSLQAQKNYQKYLGDIASKAVAKSVLGYVPPQHYSSSHYVRTGAPIILLATDDYYRLYPDDDANVFVHHLHAPYLYLAEKLAGIPATKALPKPGSPLTGTWRLAHMPATTASLEELYALQRPTLTFEEDSQKVYGHTGCNRFGGKVSTKGCAVDISQIAAMTKEACKGKGETLFLETLKAADTYKITSNNELQLFRKETLLIQFEEKP